jgi:hypothetical protein
MAITFTGARKYSTNNVANHLFSNNMVASQCLKVRVESAAPPNIPYQLNTFRRLIFCFQHYFIYSGGPTVAFYIQLNGANGTVNHLYQLTIGVTYVFVVIWDGTNQVQTCYANGVPTVFGNLSGTTSIRIDSVEMGPDTANSAIVFTLDDFNAWDNYALTHDDAIALTNNGDPTTIGTSSPWRCRWTLAGTTGQTPVIGDAGLKNAYGTGSSDGSDFATVTGSGTAVYADPLVWAPTVTPHVYVTGCGKLIGGTFTSNHDGSLVIPSQVLSTPTIKVNGTDHGALTIPWGGATTGVHQCMLFSTPGTPPLQINPGDTVELTAPPAWLNTPAGSVAALSGPIDNRSGGSSVQVENLTKTLRPGFGLGIDGVSQYYPLKNSKYQMGQPGNFGKVPPGLGYQLVNQPCEAGLILLVWDALKPATPAICSLSSGNPSRVTVTHLPQYDVSPSNGIGYQRVYQVAYVDGSDYETVANGSPVWFGYTDPAYTDTSNYDNRWIYLAGEWSFDGNGNPVFDRSDQFAISSIHLDRVPQNVGTMRGLGGLPGGAACDTFPYPELLIPRTTEFFWGYQPLVASTVGFLSAGPVDPTATPWIYSALFRQPANQFAATLVDTISTTPAVGTQEVWHFSDGATAPLMAGLEVQVDSEVVRILSGSNTAWTVYRGSSGTTPGTHSPGPVTVYGRQPITTKVAADGTAPYTAPCFMQCDKPHGMTTLHGYLPFGTLSMTMADGTVDPNFGLSQPYVTGPTTFVSIWSGYYPQKPAGTKPSQTYTLNPANNFLQKFYQPLMPIDFFCEHVGKFPSCNMHLNVPLDACDDMVYTYARIARDHFPAGRRIYVEWANEPWNWAPPFKANIYCTMMAPLTMPANLNTYALAYYAYRAAQVHAIFRSVFQAAGRSTEIYGLINCQPGSGQEQVTPHLNLGLAVGQPFDAVSLAPYFTNNMSADGTAATIAAINQYDNDQVAEQLLHDVTYDTTGIISALQNVVAAVAAYNTAHGKTCVTTVYEGGPDDSRGREPGGHAAA